jgi:hypothetical protein
VIRIAVGLAALGSVLFASKAELSYALSLAGVVVTLVLNILPVQKWELDCRVVQTRWAQLRSELQQFEVALYGGVLNLTMLIRTKGQFEVPLTKGQSDRLAEIVAKRNDLNPQDPLRWQWRINRTWKQETARRYGKGVVTPEQQREAIKKLRGVSAMGRRRPHNTRCHHLCTGCDEKLA